MVVPAGTDSVCGSIGLFQSTTTGTGVGAGAGAGVGAVGEDDGAGVGAASSAQATRSPSKLCTMSARPSSSEDSSPVSTPGVVSLSSPAVVPYPPYRIPTHGSSVNV